MNVKIVEIITLRHSVGRIKQIEIVSLLREIQGEQNLHQPQTMLFYIHADLETDISVHLHRFLSREEQAKSDFGIQLAEALRKYGLVHHSVWHEVIHHETNGQL